MKDFEKNIKKYFFSHLKLFFALFPYALTLMIIAPVLNNPYLFFKVWIKLSMFIVVPIGMGVIIYLISKGKKGNLMIKPSIVFISKHVQKIFWIGIGLFYFVSLVLLLFFPIYKSITIFFLIGGTFIILPGIFIFLFTMYSIDLQSKNMS